MGSSDSLREASAPMKPANSETSTMIEVQPGTTNTPANFEMTAESPKRIDAIEQRVLVCDGAMDTMLGKIATWLLYLSVGILTVTGLVTLWIVIAIALVLGLVTAIDNPARQSFVTELVGTARTVNAVALNSVIVHTARIVGPALAGIVIALVLRGTRKRSR